MPEAGTLSRVLYRDDRLRVVGFASAAGQELTEHTSALPVVVRVERFERGRLDLAQGEERNRAGPGSWIHLPARLPACPPARPPACLPACRTRCAPPSPASCC
ncbi:hypothetical protein [Streptomyces sp. NPDC088766]|uniref:hypothetical protein n=1 Tax=Streptomyces sp. NPDC088766 TaxID=3365893 RepID=UPI00380D6895